MADLTIRPDFRVVCGGCGAEVTGDECEATPDYRTFWVAQKEAGWRAFRDEQQVWQKRCPECMAKWRKPADDAEIPF